MLLGDAFQAEGPHALMPNFMFSFSNTNTLIEGKLEFRLNYKVATKRQF